MSVSPSHTTTLCAQNASHMTDKLSDLMPDNSTLCAQKGSSDQQEPSPSTAVAREAETEMERAMEGVTNLARDAELQQLQTKNAILETENRHLRDACDTKNQMIKGMEDHLSGLKEQRDYIKEQKDEIRKQSERQIEQLRTENEELKKAVAAALERRPVATAATAAGRAKEPGEGRTSNLPKGDKTKVSDIDYTRVEYFVRKGIQTRDALRDHITELYSVEKNLYWEVDKANAKAQSKYKADWIWDLLSYRTDKYGRGKMAEMIEYLKSNDDLQENGEQWDTREAQIASWFYPNDDGSTDYVTNQMSKAMTAIEMAHKLYNEYYVAQKDWPTGFDKKTMDIPPSPEARRADKKRKAAEKEQKKAEGRSAKVSKRAAARRAPEDGVGNMFDDDEEDGE